jgi:hypothetical protein
MSCENRVCAPAHPVCLKGSYRYDSRERPPPPLQAGLSLSARLEELIGGSGRTAERYASAARAFISSTAFE